jgi:O-acetyl-ADP-ribose deacetylase (regulator of RNase III)
MKVRVVKGDITQLAVDAIVNAANSGLLGGGGVDGAIHRAAGPRLLAECEAIVASQGGCPAGEAVMTGPGRLPCRFVIHTVGPVWRGGGQGEEALLRSCYERSLALAEGKGLSSIAFPNISTGVYGYPKAEAARVVLDWLGSAEARRASIEELVFACFDDENYSLYREGLATRKEPGP